MLEIKKEKSNNYIESILYDGELKKTDSIDQPQPSISIVVLAQPESTFVAVPDRQQKLESLAPGVLGLR